MVVKAGPNPLRPGSVSCIARIKHTDDGYRRLNFAPVNSVTTKIQRYKTSKGQNDQHFLSKCYKTFSTKTNMSYTIKISLEKYRKDAGVLHVCD